jgi:phosphoglycolate phosphatase
MSDSRSALERERAPRVETVLFDLDGTLADTLPALAGALNAALGEEGLAPVSPASLRPVVSLGTRAIVAYGAAERLDEAASQRLRERFLARYESTSTAHTLLFPGMAEVLAGLDARGIRWGVVTNKLARFARPLLATLDPRGACACLVSGDTAPHPKPHPAPLLHACTETGSPPWGCIYVGDAQGDVVAGRRAGMRTLVAAYGYLAAGATPREWGADGIIDQPLALLAWLDAGGSPA